jgi:flagellar biogenesis protein FliO
VILRRVAVGPVALACTIVALAMPSLSRGEVSPPAAIQAGSSSISSSAGSGDSSIPHTALGDQPLRSGAATASTKLPSVNLPVVTRAPSMDYQRVGVALVAVVALIFILRGLGRVFFPSTTSRGQTRVVEVLSRSALAPKQQVMLLRIGRRLIVVGDSGTQMNTLCEISDPDEVAGLVGQLREEKTTAAAAFTSLFGRFSRRYGGADERDEGNAVSELRDEPEEQPVSSARGELDGLRERVRLLSEQFNG